MIFKRLLDERFFILRLNMQNVVEKFLIDSDIFKTTVKVAEHSFGNL